VFAADGSVQTDPGFYGGKKAEPINEQYRRKGYTQEVQYLNGRILGVVRQILKDSQTPPIIILQGDHGLRKDNRYLIFNAYHLPGDGSRLLYPSITPVNSFRLVFNAYFGAHTPLLPDVSFTNDADAQQVTETRAECKKEAFYVQH
jgi:hypothetical protein